MENEIIMRVISMIDAKMAYLESDKFWEDLDDANVSIDESFIDRRAGRLEELEELRDHLQSKIENELASAESKTEE
jgi:hypothetical protein